MGKPSSALAFEVSASAAIDKLTVIIRKRFDLFAIMAKVSLITINERFRNAPGTAVLLTF
jgi:hypothetical protein